ncbi:MAG TPA: pitrilysin family protein [Phycisphaerales bacterium]|nr:pitrilysin family protein [Phycisphaerales bacterium]
MRRPRPSLAPFVLLLALLAVGPFTPAAQAQDVKYDKYTLDNGLTVILHEDHTLPIVTIDLWYRVGAKEEPRGRSGFAHLFEHLMFMGTQRVKGSDFDNFMEAGGGSNNASTSLDRTNYFSNGPASLLPTLLWLDADRMEDLGRAMTTEKLNKQRDVVRNEIRQNVENTPYGRADEWVTRYMYPVGHPYHENVYGLHEDLEAATVNNVKDFFANFYVPNNCSLVVAGDFDPATIRPMVNNLFGTIARGAPVIRREAKDWPTPVLGRVIRTTMLDKVEKPRLSFTYHSPAWYQPGDAEMDLLGAVLTQGKSSRLYKRLVLDDKTATDVSASQNSATLGSLFQIDVYARPDADLNAVEKAVDEEIAKILTSGVTAEELGQRTATIELGMLSRLDNLQAKADRLNEYEYFFGEPNSFKRDLDRYRNATPAGVQDWAKRTLTQDSRLLTRVLPEEPDRGASARDTRPADFSQAHFAPQAPESFRLSSGVNVMLWKRSELPLVSVQVVVHPGGALIDNSAAGLAYLTGEMLGEGAGSRDATQFADAVQSIGGAFGAGASQEAFTAGMTVLRRNFDAGAALLADAVRRPRLTAEDFERVQRLHIADLQQELENPQAVAGNVGLRVLLGDRHPYALPVGGTIATASAAKLADVKHLHEALFAPAFTTILVCGDVTKEQATAALEKGFGDWKPAGADRPAPPTVAASQADSVIPQASGLRVVLVDRPEAVQTVIRFMTPGPKAADPARVRYNVLNTILGGSFTSRLNQNLREEHGYTYGAGSRFVMSPMVGMFVARAAVKADTTGESLREFLKEFDRIRTKGGDISPAEAIKAAQTIRTETIQGLAGIHGPIGEMSSLLVAGLPFESVATDLAAAMKITAPELNAAGNASIPLERGVLVLVGDKTLILEQIKDLKLPPPVEYTPEGEKQNAPGARSAKSG